MSRPVAFTYQGIEYKDFPEYFAFFGVGKYEGRDWLACVGRNPDGTPDATGSTARSLDDENQTVERPRIYNVVEVTNVEDDQALVDAINEEFGTHFTLASFPGR